MPDKNDKNQYGGVNTGTALDFIGKTPQQLEQMQQEDEALSFSPENVSRKTRHQRPSVVTDVTTTPAPKLPASYNTSDIAEKLFNQQVSHALKVASGYRGRARQYFGDRPVSDSDILAYANKLYQDDNSRFDKEHKAAMKQFEKQYPDAFSRNFAVGKVDGATGELVEYKDQLAKQRLLRPEDRTFFGGDQYSKEDTKRLQERGSSVFDTAPIDYDEAFDKDNNIKVEFLMELQAQSKEQGRTVTEIFDDYMHGKKLEYKHSRQSIAGTNVQKGMNEIYDAGVLARPVYNVAQGGIGAIRGMGSVMNFLYNKIERPLMHGFDGTSTESYANLKEAMDRALPQATAENQATEYSWAHPLESLDLALTAGSTMAGEFAPALFGGESALLEGVEARLAQMGAKGGLRGLAAKYAVSGAGRLQGTFAGRLMENTVHMAKTAYPQIYSGYVDHYKQLGYTDKEAQAKAHGSAMINMVAFSVPGAIGGVGLRGLPAALLKSTKAAPTGAAKVLAVAKTFAQPTLGGGAAFAGGSLVDAFKEHREEVGRFEQDREEGMVPQDAEAPKFDLGAAGHDAGQSAALGVIWGMVTHGTQIGKQAASGHGVLPNSMQTHYIASAVHNPERFNAAVDKSVARGKISAEDGGAMKGFIERIAPAYKELTTPQMTREEALAKGYTGRAYFEMTRANRRSPFHFDQPKAMDKHTAVQLAVEGERLKETAEEIQALTGQLAAIATIDENGQKTTVAVGYDPQTGEYTEAAGREINAQIVDLKEKARQSAVSMTKLREGTYLDGRTVSSKEMLQMAGRATPGDGLQVEQARRITDNGPYTVKQRDISSYEQSDPVVARMVRQLKGFAPGRGPMGEFDPKHTNPVVIDGQGNIIDGQKRVAYAIAHGETMMDVAEPVRIKTLTDAINSEAQGKPLTPNPEGLPPELRPHFDTALETFEGSLKDKKAGVSHSRAYAAAAEYLQGVDVERDAAIDILTRLNSGKLSVPMAEAIYNEVVANGGKAASKTKKASGKPNPAMDNQDPIMQQSPHWDAVAGKMKDGYGPGEEHWDEEWFLQKKAEADAAKAQNDADAFKEKKATEEAARLDRERAEEEAKAKAAAQPATPGVPPAGTAPQGEEPGRSTGKKPTTEFFPLREISTDEQRFQNREGLDEQNVQNIVDNYREADFDPIHIWRDPDDGKYYVLSGHHRLEAARRLNLEDVKVEVRQDFDEAGAIKYATEEANANRKMETPVERSNIYRADREKGMAKKDIEEKAKKLEGKNASYIMNLAHLALNGKVMGALRQFKEAGNKELQAQMEKISDWIGEVRRSYPMLTDAHEAELFDFLSDKTVYDRIKTKAEFKHKVGALAGTMYFDAAEPLNIQRQKFESDAERQYNEERRALLDQQHARQEEINALNARFKDPSDVEKYVHPDDPQYNEKKNIADDRIAKLNAEIKVIQGKVLDLQQRKSDFTRAAQNQGGLFDQLNTHIDNGTTNAATADAILGGTGTGPDGRPINATLEAAAQDAEQQAEALGNQKPGTPGRKEAAANALEELFDAEQQFAGGHGDAEFAGKQLIIEASDAEIEKAGWHEGHPTNRAARKPGSIRHLHEMMRTMFGDKANLVITNSAGIKEYHKSKGREYSSDDLVPPSAFDPETNTIRVDIERTPPQAFLDELGHLWNSWARSVHAEQLDAHDKKIASGSLAPDAVRQQSLWEWGIELAENSDIGKWLLGSMHGDTLPGGKPLPIPKGVTVQEANRWGKYIDHYKGRNRAKENLLDELIAQFIMDKSVQLAMMEGQAPSVKTDKDGKPVIGKDGKPKINRGNWADWLKALWDNVAKLKGKKGFGKHHGKSLADLQLGDFAQSVSEELALGKPLTKRIRTISEVENAAKSREEKKVEKIGEEFVDILDERKGGGKPGAVDGEGDSGGESMDGFENLTSDMQALGKDVGEAITGGTIVDFLERAIDSPVLEDLQKAVLLSDYYKTLPEGTDPTIALESVLSNPSVLTTPKDHALLGGFRKKKQGRGSNSFLNIEITGPIADAYRIAAETTRRLMDSKDPDDPRTENLTEHYLAQFMERADNMGREKKLPRSYVKDVVPPYEPKPGELETAAESMERVRRVGAAYITPEGVKQGNDAIQEIVDAVGLGEEATDQQLAQAYLQAKSDGSNPALVEATEGLFGSYPKPKPPKQPKDKKQPPVPPPPAPPQEKKPTAVKPKAEVKEKGKAIADELDDLFHIPVDRIGGAPAQRGKNLIEESIEARRADLRRKYGRATAAKNAALNERWIPREGEDLEQNRKDAESAVFRAKQQLNYEKQSLKELAGRERGANWLTERLSRAARKDELSQEAADLAIDLIRTNPEVFDDIGISIKGEAGLEHGFFAPLQRVVTIMRNSSDHTAAHELLHATERWLPQEVREGIMGEWAKALQKEMSELQKKLRGATEEEAKKITDHLEYLGFSLAAHGEPDIHKREAIRKASKEYIADGRVDANDYYQHHSPSEWWAVNGSKKFAELRAGDKTSGWVAKAKAFYENLIKSIKNVFGLNATKHVERGLKAIMDGATNDDAGSLLTNAEKVFSMEGPVDREKETKRRVVAEDLVETFIDEGNTSLADIMTALYSLKGDKAEAMFPYVKSAYLSYQGRATDEVLDVMDDVRTVRNFDYQSFKNTLNDVSDTSGNMEPGGGGGGTGDGLGQKDVQGSGPGGNESSTGLGGKQTGEGGSGERGGKDGVPPLDAPAGGSTGNGELFQQPPGTGGAETGGAGRGGPRGSGWYGGAGLPHERGGQQPTVVFTDPGGGRYSSELDKQKAAEGIPVEVGDPQNIADTLPFLFPSQHEDILFAEKRLNQEKGYGVLFSNGAGTGKTLTALGIAKRMIKAGRTNGLIVAPSQEVINEWVKYNAPYLGIPITKLLDKRDPGNGVAITTFANFGDNTAIFKRKYDWVIVDEAQNLMSSGDAKETKALDALRALTFHAKEGTHHTLAQKKNPVLYTQLETASAKYRTAKIARAPEEVLNNLRAEHRAIANKWEVELDKAKADIIANQGEKRPRTVFLSATPFAYRKNLQWAEGFLFDYEKPSPEPQQYNEARGFAKLMVDNFGYRMRYNKLTEPDAGVDTGLMEREFNKRLYREGVMSNRMLELDSDYERKFALTPNAVGTKIDEGMDFMRESDSYNQLYSVMRKRFDYLRRARLLEAIKAKEAIPIIKKLHAQGKQVVVFHEFIQGGGFSPFRFDDMPNLPTRIKRKDGTYEELNMHDLIKRFYEERPDLANMNFDDLPSPLEALKEAFPNAGIANGTPEAKKSREAAIKNFNDDSKPENNLIIVQSNLNAGWSGHDKTGKHPRVLINLGLPTAPTRAIQQEGRIYRVGQHKDSNSMFMYMNTGTNWERAAFAEKIAERASTAENLAMGDKARMLKESFITKFEDSEHYEPSDKDGTGSRDEDRRAAGSDMTVWEKAKSYYYANQKKTQKNKAQEGQDYFATPEPVGLKMVEWADVRNGEDVLEPSAGHGAIARWFPELSNRTIVEPSNVLMSKAGLNVLGSRQVHDTFENLHINNKFDSIVMNPPYGHAGKTAMDHVEKAAAHLRKGGRMVALVPEGKFNDRFEKWMYEKDEDGNLVRPEFHLIATIKMPSSTFGRAGTTVSTQILVIDRELKPESPTSPQRNVDMLRDAQDNKELFDMMEHMTIPARPVKPVEEAEESPVDKAKAENAMEKAGGLLGSRSAQLEQQTLAASAKGVADLMKPSEKALNTKTGKDIYKVPFNKRISKEGYAKVKAIAEKNEGYYSRFTSSFVFDKPETAEAFRTAVHERQQGPDNDLFHIPMESVEAQAEEVRKALDLDDDGRAFHETMEELGENASSKAMTVRGELFHLPLTKVQRTDALLPYWKIADRWDGRKEGIKFRALHGESGAAGLQKEIQKTVGERPHSLLFKKLAAWKKEWRETDKAIHIYMDTKRNPDHIKVYEAALADARKTMADPKATEDEKARAQRIINKEEVVTRSQNLTDAQKAIADKMRTAYDKMSQWAMDNGVIGTMLEDYVGRTWDFGEKHNLEDARRFGLSTRHSLQRKLETVLEGYALGYDLKTEGASNNLAQIMREVETVVANREMLDQAMSLKDVNGLPLMTTSARTATDNGYVLVNHPAMRKWTYRGTLSDYSAAERQKFGKSIIVQPNGAVIEKMPIYAQQHIARDINNVTGSGKITEKPFLKHVYAVNQAIKMAIFFANPVFHGINFVRHHALTGAGDDGKHGKVLGGIKSLWDIRSAYKEGARLIQESDPHLRMLIELGGMRITRNQDFIEMVDGHSTMLGRFIDSRESAIGGMTKAIKDKILAFNKEVHIKLFEGWGASLKAFDSVMKLRKELAKEENKNLTEEQLRDLCSSIARKEEDHYGGQAWDRMRYTGEGGWAQVQKNGYYMMQDPTVRQAASLFLLAPDWTISNLRIMTRMLAKGRDGELYRRMWSQVLMRGAALTVGMNLLMSLWDDEDENGKKRDPLAAFVDNYRKAWKAGDLKWLDVDISPMYHAMGGQADKRAYFSIFGAFKDPIKAMGIRSTPHGTEWDPLHFVSSKSSYTTRALLDFGTGENWEGKTYTDFDELLGMDATGEKKKDYYQRSHRKGEKKSSGGVYKEDIRRGDKRFGKHKGQVMKYPDEAGWHPVGFKNLPSYLYSEVRGAMPTTLQSVFAGLAGERDIAQVILQGGGTGTSVIRDPDTYEVHKHK